MIQSDDLLYSIKQSPNMGRYLVAARDIYQSQVICSERPLVIGPKQATNPVCLSCYRRVDGSYLCASCGWPMCNETCQLAEDHRLECQFFSEQRLMTTINFEDDCSIYDCITPLRCLFVTSQSADNKSLLLSLESHENHRKRVGIWYTDQISVVDVLRNQWGLGDRYSQQDVQTVCGILEINSFEVADDEINARAVYATACLMSHDCVPNAVCIIDQKGHMVVKAAVDISAGTMITTSYTFTLDSTQRRRQHLRDTKFFDCLCLRCLDPTELGTHLSSLTCPNCEHAWVVADDPLDTDSSWHCTGQCGFNVDANHVTDVLNYLQYRADCIGYDDLAGLEGFLSDAFRLLHHNHSILIGIKYYLCHFYGKAPGHLLEEMPNVLIERKIKLCREFLALAHILEPGPSKMQGGVLRNWTELCVDSTAEFLAEMKAAEDEIVRRNAKLSEDLCLPFVVDKTSD